MKSAGIFRGWTENQNLDIDQPIDNFHNEYCVGDVDRRGFLRYALGTTTVGVAQPAVALSLLIQSAGNDKRFKGLSSDLETAL